MRFSYLPPVVVCLIDEQQDFILLHVDPFPIFRDVLKVEGHLNEDLMIASHPVAAGGGVVTANYVVSSAATTARYRGCGGG